MRKMILLFLLLVLTNFICYGEINFDYQFSVPIWIEDTFYQNIWLADCNGDDQEELYIFYGNQFYTENWVLAEYDLNGELISVQNGSLPENIWYSYDSMYKSDDTVYLLQINERATEISIYCDLIVYEYNSMTMIDSLSIAIGEGTGMDGYFFWVNYLEIVEINGTEFLYLGLKKDFDFGCMESSSNSFMYKCLFDEGMLSLLEEIPNAGTSWLYPPGAESIMSIGYSDYWCTLEPDSSICRLNSVSFDTPAIVDEIMQVEIDQYHGLSMQFQNNFDDYYMDYGLVVWESLDNMLHCYSPDLSNLLWESAISSPSVIYMGPSTCVTTNMGNNFIMYFFNDNYVEVTNRITGNAALREQAQIVPFKILHKSDGELLFLTGSDSLFSVYTLAGEIQLDNDQNEIIANDYGLHNYPNPFNPETVISFNLPQAAEVELKIYNIKGQKVYKLAEGNLTAGNHEYYWNGKDEKGTNLSSGIYYYSLQINGNCEAVGKCVLMK